MTTVLRNGVLVFIAIITLVACQQAGLSNQKKVSKTASDLTQANISLAIAYMNEGEYEQSLEKLNRAKQSDPSYPPIYNVYGLLYQRIGQLDKAEKSYQKALSLDADNSSSLNNYGQFLCQQKKPQEAKKVFLKAVANPFYDRPEVALTNIGLCFDNNGQAGLAEEYYRQALQRNPEMSPALLRMCEISFNNNDYLSARAYLQRYQSVSQHIAKSLWLGVQIEQELGDKNTAGSYALLLKNLFSDSDEAMRLRESGIQ